MNLAHITREKGNFSRRNGMKNDSSAQKHAPILLTAPALERPSGTGRVFEREMFTHWNQARSSMQPTITLKRTGRE
jgi:hypothetical protein